MKLGRDRLPVIILQNKIDLMRESQAREQYEQILQFVRGMVVVPGIVILPALGLWNDFCLWSLKCGMAVTVTDAHDSVCN